MSIPYSIYYLQYAFREWWLRITSDIPDDFWNAINIGYYQI